MRITIVTSVKRYDERVIMNACKIALSDVMINYYKPRKISQW